MIVKLCCLLVLTLTVVSAQETASDGLQLWTAASLTQMAQELKTQAAGDPHHVGTRKLADFQNDLFMLAHRKPMALPSGMKPRPMFSSFNPARQRCLSVATWSAAKPPSLTKNVTEQSKAAFATSFHREM